MRALASACLALVLAICLAASQSPLFAQTTVAELQFDGWEAAATRAEGAIERGVASDRALGDLRSEIADWRSQFQDQLNTNATRIDALNAQIGALGPAPAEGETEAEEIATRRAELAAQLERLSTPRRTAEEAFSRANGIISEIDRIIRTRQADQLLAAGPIPLNPAYWPTAVGDLNETFQDIGREVGRTWQDVNRRAQARDRLPLILVLSAVALILIVRSRRWTERIVARLAGLGAHRGSTLASFSVSLGQILLPYLGFVALVSAIQTSGLYSQRAAVVIDLLIPIGFVIFFARWLASRIFPDIEAVETPLGLTSPQRREGRFYTRNLGLLLALQMVLTALAANTGWADATEAVLSFPLVILTSLMIFRTGQILRKHDPELAQGTGEGEYRARIVRTVGRIIRLVALIAPLLAAAGYLNAAKMLIYPTVLTLAVLGTVMLLQEVISDAYAVLVPGAEGGEGLIPTLLGFLLLLVSIPLLALIWGARVTDLTELYARAQAGIPVGGVTISPGSLLTLIVVFAIGYFLTKALQGTLRTSVLPKTRLDAGGQTAVISGIGYIGIFLAALIAISSAGIDLSNIAIVAGALSVGIGFGLQNIVSNFVSGIILLIERPISQGDWIEVGEHMGYVRDISVRSTRIETFDRSDVIVPNADLVSGTVTNYTRGNPIGRIIITVGVAYGTDTRRVENILREIGAAHPMVLSNPAPSVFFMSFGASSLDFELRVILRDINWALSVKSELHHQIAERFVAEEIEIPFAQTDLWLRNPETLARGDRTEGASPDDPLQA